VVVAVTVGAAYLLVAAVIDRGTVMTLLRRVLPARFRTTRV
jgi:hypothetical protein